MTNRKPIKSILISVIPHNQQRYPTAGDWTLGPNGRLHIRVSNLPDNRMELAVALHELVEAALCLTAVPPITAEMVDAWDLGPIGSKLADPGADSDCPYHLQHRLATRVETEFSFVANFRWSDYENVLDDLVWNPKDPAP